MRNLILPHILLFVLLLSSTLAHGALTAETTLSHSSFPQDKVARLTLIITGTSRNATVDIPEIKDIKLHPRGQSSQSTWGTGPNTSSISYNYLVQGLRSGNYTIPAITVHAGGESAVTEPISFEISSSEQPPPPGQSEKRTLEDIAFFKISEVKDHYPGEIVPIKLQLYLDREFRVDIGSLPILSGNGVVMEPLSSEPSQSQETAGGRSYHVVTWETTLAGIKTGKHPLVFTLEASLLIPQKRRSRSPLSSFGGGLFGDSMFDDFFGNYARRALTVSSSEMIFSVLPLPEENKPDSFTGAIGDFSLSVNANPTGIEVGEPITLTTTISGKGNFDRVEAPLLPESNSWKTYTPTSDFTDGKKTFEQAIVLKNSTINEIPSLQFSYFDPAQKRYVTQNSKPIQLEVTGGTAANPATRQQPVQSTSQPRTQQPIAQVATPPLRIGGLVPQYLETGPFTTTLQPLFKKSWYISVCGLLILLSLCAAFLKYRQIRHTNNPGLQQSKMKKTRLHTDLGRVEEAMTQKDTAGFLQASRTAIQNQLGELCGVEPSAVSLADINSTVSSDSPLLQIFTLAEEAVYGGATLSDGDLDTLYGKLKSELEAMN
jgi:hypothetical protein